MQEENELIIKAKNGDKQAFGELALMYRKNVFGLIVRMTGNPLEAEDLTQDVFVRAYLSMNRFTPNRDGAFKSWILTIASRICIDRSRQLRKRSCDAFSEQDLETLTAEENVMESVVKQETERELRAALLSLPENYRMVIVLKYLEDLDYQEISRITGAPIGTVGTWLRRGLEMLRTDQHVKEVATSEKTMAK